MRRSDVGTFSKECGRIGIRAEATTASPVLESRLYKINTDQHDSRPSDNRRKDLLQELWREEREADFDE